VSATDADILAQAISDFGAAGKSTLDNPAMSGEPVDQLRAPISANAAPRPPRRSCPRRRGPSA